MDEYLDLLQVRSPMLQCIADAHLGLELPRLLLQCQDVALPELQTSNTQMILTSGFEIPTLLLQ